MTIFKLRAANFRRFARVFVFFNLTVIYSSSFAIAQNLSSSEIQRQAARLKSADAETRRDALYKLRLAGNENASRIAAQSLTDKTEIVRAVAPFSVLSLPPEEAAGLLLPQLGDKSEFVRRETAYALGKTRSARAVSPLLEILRKDKKYSVRCAAAVALGDIGNLAAAAALTQILQTKPKEDEDFLRRAAAHSIGQIAENLLAKDFFAQADAKDFEIFAAANRRFLSEKYPPLRAAVNALVQALQNRRESDDAKREAAFALGAIGDASAIPVLQSKLTAADYYLAKISQAALKKILIPTNIKN